MILPAFARVTRLCALAVALSGCADAARPDAAADAASADGSPRDATRASPDAAVDASDAERFTDASLAGDASDAADARSDGPASPLAWTDQVIYLAMPDRFVNGDRANDALGAAECFAPTDPRRFHGGDWAGMRASLGYLSDLGATALWLTPAYRQVARRPSGSCGYHGYWPDFALPDDGAIEPRLGTEAELSGLIDDLHGRSMRFVMDMVVNHAGPTARLVSQRPDWFHNSATCAGLGPSEIYCPLGTLPDLAQERADVADYLTEQSAAWTRRFALDGIRMDTAKHVPAEYFRDRWVPAMRRTRPGVFLVAEVFSEGSARDLAAALGAGFDSAFDFPMRRALRDTFALGGSVDAVALRALDTQSVLGAARARTLTTLLDNHDVARFASDTLAASGNNGTLARQRYHLALVALFTLPGIPQVYYGDEVGLLGLGDPDNRRDMPAWALTAAGRTAATPAPTETLPSPAATFDLTRALIALRRAHRGLTDGGYVELWRHNGGANNVLGFLRSDGASRLVVLINNGATEAGPITVQLRGNGVVTAVDRAEFTDGRALVDQLRVGAPATMTIANGAVSVRLPPRTAGVYALNP